MTELNGWVKLSRSMLDWEWYDDTNTKIVFLHLLLTANWEEKRYHGHVIKEGDTIIGLKALAKRLDLSVKQVRTALDHLKATGEITVKATNQFSIVTIENWAKYQVDDLQSDKRANEGQAETLENQGFEDIQEQADGKRRANEGQTKGNT